MLWPGDLTVLRRCPNVGLRGDEETCRNGHRYTPETTGVYRDRKAGKAYRLCLVCRRNRNRGRYKPRSGKGQVRARREGLDCLVCGRPLADHSLLGRCYAA